MLTPVQKRNLGKILPFGIIWMAFSFLYIFVEKGLLADLEIYPATGNPYSFEASFLTVPVLGLVMGLFLGTVEVMYLNRKFTRQSFGTKILIKNIIYVAAICVFLLLTALIGNSIAMKLPLFHPDVLAAISKFLFKSFVFWSIVFFIGAIISITLFVSEISDNLGQGVLRNFLTGKYHKPRIEERIFMFLDMKSSTTIAEKMGHVQYYELLNDCYSDITKAIVDSMGRIYQYVGDEVVVSWKLEDGLKGNNCLKCFMHIKRLFREKAAAYLKKFGIVPEFKAGLHYGRVTMGEIGTVKTDIVYTGDVLNTTARIQGLCNTYEVNILVSENLMNVLENPDEFQSEEIGECELRGREEKVRLYTISN